MGGEVEGLSKRRCTMLILLGLHFLVTESASHRTESPNRCSEFRWPPT